MNKNLKKALFVTGAITAGLVAFVVVRVLTKDQPDAIQPVDTETTTTTTETVVVVAETPAA